VPLAILPLGTFSSSIFPGNNESAGKHKPGRARSDHWVLRTIKDRPIHYWIIGSYVLVIVISLFVPDVIIGIAHDSGDATTSSISVPVATAFGIGLVSSICGRNPMLGCFGIYLSHQ
jgi:hypothetical protein